jgi:hypothetical protein
LFGSFFLFSLCFMHSFSFSFFNFFFIFFFKKVF